MTERQRALLDKAARALEAARANLDRDDAETAVNRAYYAAYYAATAALLGVGETPKTHSGAHRRFALRFIVTGQIAPEVGRTLEEAFRVRQRADYESLVVTDVRAAADLVADVERFVDAVVQLVHEA